MTTLGPAELLATWEQGIAEAPASRAVGVLALAAIDGPLTMTIGQRDAALLACYERWFGVRLDAVATCPACDEALEVSLDASELRAGATAGDASQRYEIARDGYQIVGRVPLAGDVVPLPSDRELLGRCVVSAHRDGHEVDPRDLPPAVVAALEGAMADADPGAELTIELTCPGCDHAWSTVLDPTEFVWERLDRWARRLGDDVHVLASTYGWSEADILGLTPYRRRLYLEAVRQ